jgi:LuxR family maltose regulon positive regulatory protein
MLEAIERANLFLVPLDEVRGWWRYHHLFADLLRARLHQQQPDRVPALHRAAASWHEQHGLADYAVRHAVAAGEMGWAARLIEQQFDAIFLLGESATIQRWLSALPAELIQSRARLCLARAWMALVGGDVEAVETPLDAADRAFEDAPDEPFEPSVGRAASWLANGPAAVALARAWLAYLRGDAEGTAAFASRALAKLGDGEWMLESVTRAQLALAEWLRGRLAEAEQGFASSITTWWAAGERGLAASGCHLLGQVQRGQGRLDAARRTYRQALEMTAGPGQPAPPVAGIGHVGLAEVAYQRNEFDAALRHVTEGIARCRQVNYTQPLATGLATLAWIRQAGGDARGARDAMAEAEQVAPSPAVADLFNPVPAQRARLLLALGDIAAAARWIDERGLGVDDEAIYQREREYLVLARVLLAQDRPAEALALLQRLHVAAATQGRMGSVIELRALQALALAASGDAAAALDALAQALTLACPEGYVRVFVDEGAPMQALLSRLVAAQRTEHAAARAVRLNYLARLLHAFDAKPVEPGGRGAAALPGVIESLTARELEVIGLLAEGKSNQSIAKELVVSLDTVKKHISHILDKLGAANRTEAVARARQLGLIP